jgi:hypothetical protein
MLMEARQGDRRQIASAISRRLGEVRVQTQLVRREVMILIKLVMLLMNHVVFAEAVRNTGGRRLYTPRPACSVSQAEDGYQRGGMNRAPTAQVCNQRTVCRCQTKEPTICDGVCLAGPLRALP